MKPAMTPQQAALSASPLTAYRRLVVGNAGLAYFLYYELCTTLCSGLAGLIGFGLRSVLYRPLFKQLKGTPAIGRGVVLRNPQVIELGKKLMLDDYSTLDAHGEGSGISIGDFVSIGRFSSVVSKSASVVIGNGVNIGSHCRLATQSKLELGDSTLIAAYCYIGPGNHQPGDSETPLISREMELRGGVKIGKNVWIGTRATILDGVTIGDNAIIGAHSLVREDVPEGAVVVGTPARRIK